MSADDSIHSCCAEIEMPLDHRLERAVLKFVPGLEQQPSARDDVLDIVDAQRGELRVEIFPAATIAAERTALDVGVEHGHDSRRWMARRSCRRTRSSLRRYFSGASAGMKRRMASRQSCRPISGRTTSALASTLRRPYSRM